MNIGKGTADYTDEDMVLMNNGKFKMVDLPNVGGSGDNLLQKYENHMFCMQNSNSNMALEWWIALTIGQMYI